MTGRYSFAFRIRAKPGSPFAGSASLIIPRLALDITSDATERHGSMLVLREDSSAMYH